MASTTRKRQTTKKGSSGRKSSGRSAARREEERRRAEIRGELLFWTGLAVTVLLFLCNFHLIGKAGNAVSGVMFGLFGVLAYIVPLFVFFGILYCTVNFGEPAVVLKEIGAGLLFFTAEVLFAMIGGIDKIGTNAKEYYAYGKDHILSGGLIGGGIAKALSGGIGKVGTVILAIIFLIICFVLMTERSMLTALRRGSEKLYDNVQEGREYRLDRRAERYEERQIRDSERRERSERIREKQKADQERYHKSVKGVTMDTDLSGGSAGPGDMGEMVPVEDVPAAAPGGSGKKKAAKSAAASGGKDEKVRIITLEDMENVRIRGLGTEAQQDALVEDAMQEGSLANAVIAAASVDPNELTRQEETGASEKEPSARKHRIELKPEEPTEEIQDLDMESISEALSDEADRLVAGDYARPEAAPTKKGEAVSAAGKDGMKETAKEAQTQEPIPAPKPKVRKKPYKKPPVSLLKEARGGGKNASERQLKETARVLQQTLETFKVKATVTDISMGPAVTRFELQPEPGVKVSKIVSLSDDIKLALAATDIRIEAPIPGKSAVGIEVPNKENTMVSLRELIDSREFKDAKSNLSFAVGKDIGGSVIVSDIAKMPHVLIAGSTGSGKSVCINTLIMSILYKATPEEVKLILVDPKVVELSVYNDIPHLLLPVVTDPKKAAAALQWGVAEMMDRYKKFEEQGVRDLKGYNARMANLTTNDGQSTEKLPQIVIIVDELADLMMVAPGEVEDSICRLAQLARAAGIHLVIATQRPSVDVITGLIKANMPSRIAFAVSSGIDSRTILDMVGAEKLLGKGDMLFYPQGIPKPVRVQGAFVSDEEVENVVAFLRESSDGASDEEENPILKQMEAIGAGEGGKQDGGSDSQERDKLFADAGRCIIEREKASSGMLQRVFKIGFNRAARIMDQLAEYGVVGPEEGTKPRKVLMTMAEFEQLLNEI